MGATGVLTLALQRRNGAEEHHKCGVRQPISRHSTRNAVAGGSNGASDDTTSHPSRPSRLSSRSFLDRRPCHSIVQYS
jgi:hypothetical protein